MLCAVSMPLKSIIFEVLEDAGRIFKKNISPNTPWDIEFLMSSYLVAKEL